MKKFILLPLVGAFLYLTLSSYYYGPANGGLGDRTGATGTSGCGGLGCHSSSASSSTSVTVQLLSGSTVVTSYIPGNVYTLKISATNTSSSTLPNFGFQMSVVGAASAGTGSASYAGTMSSAPSSTHIYTGSGAQIFEHYNASFGDGSIAATTGSGGSGSTYVETITWTAPAAGSGSVIIYGVVNAVNHNFAADGGDLWNTASPVTICEAPANITGTMTVCATGTTTLSDATSGGTWSSLSPSTASVGATTGTVTGVASGTATINYTTSCGTVSAVVTVNPSPAAILGTLNVCTGSSVGVTDATTGGTWTSFSSSVAGILGSGTSATISGVAAAGGTSLISYTLPTGCAATAIATVSPIPTAIAGTMSLCQGATTTLSSGAGGTWSSAAIGVATVGSTGIVTGVATGSSSTATAVITYRSAAGCAVSATVTVNPLPTVPVPGGATSICQGATTTLTDGTGGGVWTSGTTAVATIGTGSGTLTAVATGSGSTATDVITYRVTNIAGCSNTATVTITVNPLPTVSAITGTATVCQGGNVTLTDATTGGIWGSSAPGVATVGTSGTVAGVASGSAVAATAVISYSVTASGCTAAASATVTVNPLPLAITGSTSVCSGGSATLSDGSAPGSWSSNATAIATIGSASGVVTGVASAGGTAVISYTLSTGCSTTYPITVNAAPVVTSITGTLNVCVGSATTLGDVTGGGTWSSSNGNATVGSTGIVTGVVSGTTVIFYTITSGSGCPGVATTTVTVNDVPAPIGGPASVCTGAIATITDGIGGGSWASSNTLLATIGTAGIATGLTVGLDTIIYTLPTGCAASRSLSVNPSPSDFAGPAVCVGGTSTLSSTPTGGIWTSGTPAQATIGSSSGLVTGVAAGTPSITYTIITGCFLVRPQVVNAGPLSITGLNQVCVGANISLADASAGGSWSSSNTLMATVGSTGVVTGVGSGVLSISYTSSLGCSAIRAITVNPTPSAISGPSSVCAGGTITMTDGPGSGTWTSGNTATATVGGSSGIVTGVAAGSTLITFALPTGCVATAPITVNALSPVSGLSSLCAGTTTSLTDAASGGAWSSSNPTVGTIDASSGLLTAIAPGTTTITYVLLSGCSATSTVTVISSPSAISGPSGVCPGSTISLTDAGGGVWISSNPSVATVNTTGLVTPVTIGTVTITYSLGTSCTVSTPVSVNPLPVSITGTAAVCPGAVTTLTDVTPGGSWSSSNANATVTGGTTTGSVAGVTAGVSVISYTLGTGCFATRTVTISTPPVAITGSLVVCAAATTTLSDGSGAGTWSSATPGTATVGITSGIVTGVSTGTSNVTFTLTSTGCTASATVTVSPSPAAITGATDICVGGTATLTDATGTWTSSNANSTIGSATGVVTGVTSGTSVITFTDATGCFAVRTVSIDPIPTTISGTESVCLGSTTALHDGVAGGSWSSGTLAVATVASATGVVTGITTGPAIISYTSGAGCVQTVTVTVNPLPAIITGTAIVCAGSTTTLSDAVSGGLWTSAAPATAMVVASGAVTGIAAGVATISYSFPTGCSQRIQVTVNAVPAHISGPDSICLGSTVTLTDGAGGVWSSSAPAIVAIGSTGVASGTALGTSLISYTLSTGCAAAVSVTVNSLPSAIGGATALCAGNTATLTDATTGGIWTSGASGTATITSTGVVSGVAGGTAPITYTSASGCVTTGFVTVNPLPAAIGGTTAVCPGSFVTLTDAGGGAWTTGSTSIVIGSGSGTVTGVAAGIATITYTLPTGCMTTAPFTVNPLPAAGSITGSSSVCADSGILLTATVASGVWLSVSPAIATVSVTGRVTGITAGGDTIKYTVTNVCGSATAFKIITVNPLPVAGTITGGGITCLGSTASLTDAAAGGIWSSSNTAIATIGSSSGRISAITAGEVTITYAVTNGCGVATATAGDTVVAPPSAGSISGADSVCIGDEALLEDFVSGGVWSASNGNATVGTTGIVTGVTPGTDTIRYTVAGTCGPVSATLLINVRSHTTCNVAVKPLSLPAGEFSVYPNPSSGAFSVDVPVTGGDVVLSITDVTGRRIMTQTAPASTKMTTVNFSGIAPGSYIVTADGNGQAFRGRVQVW